MTKKQRCWLDSAQAELSEARRTIDWLKDKVLVVREGKVTANEFIFEHAWSNLICAIEEISSAKGYLTMIEDSEQKKGKAL